jgi:peptidoglycan/xylan/chitin deacetylase (PgdA/CDA1 family)
VGAGAQRRRDVIRRLAKHAAAVAIRASGADRVLAGAARRADAPLVLCYHRVVDDPEAHPWCAPAMLVSLATLERQLDWVGRRHDFVDLDTLARVAAGQLVPRRPVAAVTFDDGYLDVVRLGLPLLARKGIPAALFVVSDQVGSPALHRHD